MKSFLSFTSLLIFNLGVAQNYSFNLLTDYLTTGSNFLGPYETHTISYSNTKELGYLLILRKLATNNFAYIQDSRSGQCHHFNFSESKEGGEIMFEFFYEATYTHGYQPHDCNCQQIVTQKDSTAQILNLNYFENTRKMRKNKPHSKVELTIVKNDVNLFPLYQRLFLSSHNASVSKAEGIQGIVKSAVSRGKIEYSRRLVYKKNVDFTIAINKQKLVESSNNRKWEMEY